MSNKILFKSTPQALAEDTYFKITDYDAGWMCVDFAIQGDRYCLPISLFMGYSMFYLLGVLYCMHPQCPLGCLERELYLNDYLDKDEVGQLEVYHGDRARFNWDGEGRKIIWSMQKARNENRAQSQLSVNLQHFQNDQLIADKTYEIGYRALTEAVVRCLDAFIREYGLVAIGRDAFSGDFFRVRRFIFLKAYVLGRLNEVLLREDPTKMSVAKKSDFAAEMSILTAPLP